MSNQSAPIVLNDGQLNFSIRNRETGESVNHFADVMALRLVFQECEAAHNLQVENGAYVPTSAFTADARARIAAIGLPDCSLTEADCGTSVILQLWSASIGGMDGLKKNTNETPNSPSGSMSRPESPSDASAPAPSLPPADSPTPSGSGY